MRPVFDLISEIYENIAAYLFVTGCVPGTLVVSPRSYQRLLELECSEPSGLVFLRTLSVVIDEVLPDTEVRVG